MAPLAVPHTLINNHAGVPQWETGERKEPFRQLLSSLAFQLTFPPKGQPGPTAANFRSADDTDLNRPRRGETLFYRGFSGTLRLAVPEVAAGVRGEGHNLRKGE